MSRFLGFLARRARADARTTGRGSRTRTREAGATTEDSRRRHDRLSASMRAARAPARVPRTGASDRSGFATGVDRHIIISLSVARPKRRLPRRLPVHASRRHPTARPTRPHRHLGHELTWLFSPSTLSSLDMDQATEVARRKKRSLLQQPLSRRRVPAR